MKYGNTPTTRAGRSFASKLEAAVFDYLCMMEKNGEIAQIEHQVHVYLTDARIHCIPDFRVYDLKICDHVYYEAKGYASERWPTILKLWKVYGPGRLRIVKGSYRNLQFEKEIIPRL